MQRVQIKIETDEDMALIKAAGIANPKIGEYFCATYNGSICDSSTISGAIPIPDFLGLEEEKALLERIKPARRSDIPAQSRRGKGLNCWEVKPKMTNKQIITDHMRLKGEAITHSIRQTEKSVIVHVPENRNFYGILQAARDLHYNRADVAAALKHDGWANLEEIDESEGLDSLLWLAERCKLSRCPVLK